MKLKIFLRLFGVIAIILTVFPYISTNEWYVRIFDFPHLQLTLLTMIALLIYFIGFDIKSKLDYVFVVVLSACFIFQGIKIYPYTAFGKFEVQDSSTSNTKDLSIYTANVLQKNNDRQSLLSDIRDNDADVLLFTETNKEWVRSLSTELDRQYDYKVEVPLDNTYGMVLFSKLKLHEPQVRYMIEDTIPSIHSQLLLNSNDTIQLYAIHPAPPTPSHNPSSVDRDAEMMKIAKHSRDSRFPVVVLGDFNDVAWSETTELFQKVSGLLDMRKGRGLYSTYNAKSWIMRWPLDHVFTSADFRIKKVHRGASVGSDHFPFYAELTYEPDLAKEQLLPPPSKEQLKKAFEQIDEGQENKKEKK